MNVILMKNFFIHERALSSSSALAKLSVSEWAGFKSRVQFFFSKVKLQKS